MCVCVYVCVQLISDRVGEEIISSEDVYPAEVVATGNMSNGYSSARFVLDVENKWTMRKTLHFLWILKLLKSVVIIFFPSCSLIGIEIAVDSPTDCPLNNSLHSM